MDPRWPETLTAPDSADAGRSQFRSRERVRELAEVYTHEREVHAMLDLLPDMFPTAADPGNIDRTFLEPACGHGNFLVEILRRKLACVTTRRCGSGESFEHHVLRCLASIYGIDISEENVRESRKRLRSVIGAHVSSQPANYDPSAGFGEAVEAILETNVVCGDTLSDAAEIELVDYQPGSRGTFVREWSRLDPAANEPTLFALSPRHDEVPVHYAELRHNPGPVRRGAGAVTGKAA